VALICPPHLLEKYGTTTKYHLSLPHLFRNQKYLNFYQTRSDKGDFIILDNGAAEGALYGHKHLFTMAEQIGASEVVIPDTLGDANETLAQAQYFARFARPEYEYMFVLQGKTMEEVLFCLRALDNGNMFSYVTAIGIPRHLTSIDKNFRINLAEFLVEEAFNTRYNFHFLGASTWAREIVMLGEIAQKHEGFRGLDTSYPIYMGLEDQDIKTAEYLSRPVNYFERSDDNSMMIRENIYTYLQWALYDETSS
jgi:hypothetical protein